MEDEKGKLFAVLVSYLWEGGWRHQVLEDETGVRMTVEGRNGTWLTVVLVREEEEQVLVYSIASFLVPEARRRDMAELLTRANFNMVIGNFELGYDSGEVRFKTSLDVEGSLLDAALLERLIDVNLAMMDRYLPAVTAVLEGTASPSQATEQIEHGLPS